MTFWECINLREVFILFKKDSASLSHFITKRASDPEQNKQVSGSLLTTSNLEFWIEVFIGKLNLPRSESAILINEYYQKLLEFSQFFYLEPAEIPIEVIANYAEETSKEFQGIKEFPLNKQW